MPGPMKLLLSGQIKKRLQAIKDDEIGKTIQLAFEFCARGLFKFANLLGWDVSIEVNGYSAGADGQGGFVWSERMRQDSTSALLAGGVQLENVRDRLEGRDQVAGL